VGRNDKVTIKNIKTAEKKEMKYKHAEKLVNSGEWMIIGNG
jgi:preprotein translocase subunit SecA